MTIKFEVCSLESSPPHTNQILDSLELAKQRGLETAQDGSHVWIEGRLVGKNDECSPIPMWGFRYDKTDCSWVETSLPFNIEEFFNDRTPCFL